MYQHNNQVLGITIFARLRNIKVHINAFLTTRKLSNHLALKKECKCHQVLQYQKYEPFDGRKNYFYWFLRKCNPSFLTPFRDIQLPFNFFVLVMPTI